MMDNVLHPQQPSYYPKKKKADLGRTNAGRTKNGAIAPAIAAALLYVKTL